MHIPSCGCVLNPRLTYKESVLSFSSASLADICVCYKCRFQLTDTTATQVVYSSLVTCPQCELRHRPSVVSKERVEENDLRFTTDNAISPSFWAAKGVIQGALDCVEPEDEIRSIFEKPPSVVQMWEGISDGSIGAKGTFWEETHGVIEFVAQVSGITPELDPTMVAYKRPDEEQFTAIVAHHYR